MINEIFRLRNDFIIRTEKQPKVLEIGINKKYILQEEFTNSSYCFGANSFIDYGSEIFGMRIIRSSNIDELKVY